MQYTLFHIADLTLTLHCMARGVFSPACNNMKRHTVLFSTKYSMATVNTV